ncbi:MAG: GNAT family N-acetyltransferase [Thermodesulfobacteriota bacterium]
MEIKKLDLKKDDLNHISDLIIKAYQDSGQSAPFNENSIHIIKDLIQAGNNFLGHENIYLGLSENNLIGLVIGYTGKSYSKTKTLFALLIKLKLNQILNYLILSSQLFDTLYTPHLSENDYYVSVIVVDKQHRNQGYGSSLLRFAIENAKNIGCKRVVLDVDQENNPALSLYNRFGFKIYEGLNKDSEISDNTYLTMEYKFS